jgi:hypothetical protein
MAIWKCYDLTLNGMLYECFSGTQYVWVPHGLNWTNNGVFNAKNIIWNNPILVLVDTTTYRSRWNKSHKYKYNGI